jgi:hypothetical protein
MARRATWSTRGRPCGGDWTACSRLRRRRRTRCTCRWATRTRTTGAGSAARGHGHPAERVQGHAEEPGVRRRRRDRGGAGGRVPRVPDLRPDLFVQTAAGGAKGTAVIYLVCIVHKDSLLSSGASCPVCVYICRRSISRTGTEARTATRSAPWPALLLLLLRLPSKRRYLLNGAVDSLLVLIHLC